MSDYKFESRKVKNSIILQTATSDIGVKGLSFSALVEENAALHL
jgi:hypothetical protein